MVKRVGVWKEAATVWPTSTAREMTTPSTGERMIGVAQVGPGLQQGTAGLGDTPLGGLQSGLGRLVGGLCHIIIALGYDAVGQQFPVAIVGPLRIGQSDSCLQQIGFSREEVALGLLHGGIEK